MAESGSVVVRPTSKWHLALAVGLPVAVGVGYWYVKNKEKKEKLEKVEEKDKTKVREISIDDGISGCDMKEQNEKKPLELATALKEEGNKHFKASNFEKAISCYEEAITICPPSETMNLAIFYQNIAAAYEQLQKYEDVKTACTKALSLNPKYIKAFLRRSKAYKAQNELQEALEDIIAAVILQNFQCQATLLTADVILKNLGRKHAKEAMAIRVPVMPSASFIKTYFASFVNDPIKPFLAKTDGDTSRGFLKAVDCFKREDYNSIIAACTEEINLTEAEAIYKNEALVLRATFYTLTGEVNPAMADLDSVINNEEANPKLRSNALIKRGSIYMQLEDTRNSINDFNAAVKVDQDNSDIYHHRGQVNLLMEKIKEAADDFKVAVELSPNNPITIVQRCFTEYQKALFTKDVSSVGDIMQNFENILEKYPDCTECYTLYAQVFTDQQEFRKADELFQRAIEIDPKNAVLYVRRAMLILQWTSDVETAIKYINEALAIDDKCEFAYEILGTIEVQRGNLEKGVEMFDKAIPLTKTELEMSRLFSFKDAALAQKTVAERLNVPTRDFFNI